MNQSTQTELHQPIDKCVELYNGLWLKIREQKNTLTRWMDNLFNTVNKVEKDVKRLDMFFTIENNVRCDDIEELENKLIMLEDKMENMREELRDELIREVREEMRA